MNNIFLVILFFNSLTIYSQNLTKSEFDEIDYQVDKIIQHIENHNIEKAKLILTLETSTNFDAFKSILSQKEINYNKPNGNTFVSPHYKLTESENQLELIISGIKILEKRNNEKYQRGKYYFILKTKVEINRPSNKVKFYTTEILIGEKEIEKWWLSQYKEYMKSCGEFKSLYEYVCAPPPPPPKNLK